MGARGSNPAKANYESAWKPCVPMDLARGLAADIRIGSLISADLQRLQAAAAGIAALRTMNPLLEAERERWKRLAEVAHPCMGVLEGLRMQSIRFDSTGLAGTESLRRIAEACAPASLPWISVWDSTPSQNLSLWATSVPSAI